MKVLQDIRGNILSELSEIFNLVPIIMKISRVHDRLS